MTGLRAGFQHVGAVIRMISMDLKAADLSRGKEVPREESDSENSPQRTQSSQN